MDYTNSVNASGPQLQDARHALLLLQWHNLLGAGTAVQIRCKLYCDVRLLRHSLPAAKRRYDDRLQSCAVRDRDVRLGHHHRRWPGDELRVGLEPGLLVPSKLRRRRVGERTDEQSRTPEATQLRPKITRSDPRDDERSQADVNRLYHPRNGKYVAPDVEYVV